MPPMLQYCPFQQPEGWHSLPADQVHHFIPEVNWWTLTEWANFYGHAYACTCVCAFMSDSKYRNSPPPLPPDAGSLPLLLMILKLVCVSAPSRCGQNCLAVPEVMAGSITILLFVTGVGRFLTFCDEAGGFQHMRALSVVATKTIQHRSFERAVIAVLAHCWARNSNCIKGFYYCNICCQIQWHTVC